MPGALPELSNTLGSMKMSTDKKTAHRDSCLRSSAEEARMQETYRGSADASHCRMAFLSNSLMRTHLSDKNMKCHKIFRI